MRKRSLVKSISSKIVNIFPKTEPVRKPIKRKPVKLKSVKRTVKRKVKPKLYMKSRKRKPRTVTVPREAPTIRSRSNTGNADRFLLALSQEFTAGEGGKSKAAVASRLDKRISFKNLQIAYGIDEVAFRCVNFYADKVVGPKFDLIGDKEAVKVIQNFIDKTEFYIKLEDLVRDACISGNAYWEYLKESKKIVNIARIDFRAIDYMRKSNQRVALNESGEPKGYIFGNTPYTFTNEVLYDKTEFTPSELMHFKLYPSGQDLAYGFIEPVYYLITFKRNIWSGIAQAAYNVGHKTLILKVGDQPNPNANYPGHKATPSEIDQVDGEFQDIETKHIFTVPHFVEPIQLEASGAEEQLGLITKCNIGIAISFGLPPEMVGETKGNKAIIDTLLTRDVNESIKAIQNKVSIKLETELWPLLLSQEHIRFDEVPKIRWREIAPPDKNREAKRRVGYVEAGVIAAEALRPQVMREEGLDVPEEDMKMMQKKGSEVLNKLAEGGITAQEAIVFLQNLKESFPDSAVSLWADKLIDLITSKNTAPEEPKEEYEGRTKTAGDTMEDENRV